MNVNQCSWIHYDIAVCKKTRRTMYCDVILRSVRTNTGKLAIFGKRLKFGAIAWIRELRSFPANIGGLQFSEAHHKWRYHGYSKTPPLV